MGLERLDFVQRRCSGKRYIAHVGYVGMGGAFIDLVLSFIFIKQGQARCLVQMLTIIRSLL
jgi:hypothetical protein